MESLLKELIPIGKKVVGVNLAIIMMNAGILIFVNKYLIDRI